MTQEEKIDYIYQTLKKQEARALRATLLKWGFRVAILIYAYYFITVWLPNLLSDLIPDMPSMTGSWGLNTESLKETFSKFLN